MNSWTFGMVQEGAAFSGPAEAVLHAGHPHFLEDILTYLPLTCLPSCPQVPRQHPQDQGVLLVPHHLRAALPPEGCRGHCARRALGRLLDRHRGAVGRCMGRWGRGWWGAVWSWCWHWSSLAVAACKRDLGYQCPCPLPLLWSAELCHNFHSFALTGKEDPSGRAVAGVHDAAYDGAANGAGSPPAAKKAKH